MLCSAVAAHVQNASDSVTKIICGGEWDVLFVPMERVGWGVSVIQCRFVAWAFCCNIEIQHTACKMQQRGSSIEWQLRVCCHTELQLACQSKATPRSFLYSHIFYLFLSTTFCFSLQSFIWLKLHSFPPTFPIFDLSILPVLLFYKSSILLNPPMIPYTWQSQAEILVVC